MLKMVQSNIFRNNNILFHKGLNVVLGDSEGSNSIGKSTLLMIVDFVFGGNSYIEKNNDVVRNIGHHYFEFILEFEENLYYFKRSTENHKVVEVCDNEFCSVETFTIKEYTNFLHKMYLPNNDEISFRAAVGIFSRIAQKDNFFDYKPLKVVSNSKDIEGINNLIKLFGYYKGIRDIENDIKVLNKQITTINSANKYKYIKKITKKQYDLNKKYIHKTLGNLNEIAIQFSFNINEFLDTNYQEIQSHLYEVKKQRDILVNKLKRIEKNMSGDNTIKKENFKSLKEYFDGVNVRKLQEIEEFHKNLNSILMEEFSVAKVELEKRINQIEIEISQIEQQIIEINDKKNIPNEFVQPIVDLISNINEKKQENIMYKEYTSKKNDKEKKEENLFESKKNILVDIEDKINKKMKKLNEFIYGKTNKAPKFEITEKSYYLTLPDNTGTARRYANLIIFDVSIFKLTILPFIIHDSVIFKNIGNKPMAGIIDIYDSEQKQSFISIDEICKFDEECQKTLIKNRVIELSDKETLFIKDWTKE